MNSAKASCYAASCRPCCSTCVCFFSLGLFLSSFGPSFGFLSGALIARSQTKAARATQKPSRHKTNAMPATRARQRKHSTPSTLREKRHRCCRPDFGRRPNLDRPNRPEFCMNISHVICYSRRLDAGVEQGPRSRGCNGVALFAVRRCCCPIRHSNAILMCRL